jgi:uncharacterized membrane protein
MFMLAAWAWFDIPAGQPVPVHWGIGGEPDRYGGKFESLLLFPLITFAVLGLLWLVPHIEPRRANLLRSERAYAAVWISLATFMAVVHSAAVIAATGRNVDMDLVIAAAVGALFVVIGSVLGGVQSNFMFGVRTPWTLSSDLSWAKTHRLTGRLFVLVGLAAIAAGVIGAIVGAHGVVIWVLLTGSLSAGVVAIVYSYLVWRGDPDKQAVGR